VFGVWCILFGYLSKEETSTIFFNGSTILDRPALVKDKAVLPKSRSPPPESDKIPPSPVRGLLLAVASADCYQIV
jgi:hypothetical protein